ncbi:MAG: hypothetical protein AAF664_06695 [Planctomycetota bacterium]
MPTKSLLRPLSITLCSATFLWAAVLADHHTENQTEHSEPVASSGIEQILERFDLNRDRVLSEQEIKRLLPYLPPVAYTDEKSPAREPSRLTGKTIVTSMDTDGDEMISRSEASDDLKMYFDSLDSDSNGKIDIGEAEVAAKYANAQDASLESTVESKDAKNENSGMPKGKYTGKDMLTFLDRNGDGVIMIDEATDELRPNFSFIDTDGNGHIDESEAEVIAKYANQSQIAP